MVLLDYHSILQICFFRYSYLAGIISISFSSFLTTVSVFPVLFVGFFFCLTTTLHTYFLFETIAVITAVPVFLAITFPLPFTDATDAFDDLQVTFCLERTAS